MANAYDYVVNNGLQPTNTYPYTSVVRLAVQSPPQQLVAVLQHCVPRSVQVFLSTGHPALLLRQQAGCGPYQRLQIHPQRRRAGLG